MRNLISSAGGIKQYAGPQALLYRWFGSTGWFDTQYRYLAIVMHAADTCMSVGTD